MSPWRQFLPSIAEIDAMSRACQDFFLDLWEERTYCQLRMRAPAGGLGAAPAERSPRGGGAWWGLICCSDFVQARGWRTLKDVNEVLDRVESNAKEVTVKQNKKKNKRSPVAQPLGSWHGDPNDVVLNY